MASIGGEVTGRKVGVRGALPIGASLAYTVDEFCALHRISRAYFYKIIKTELGPKTMDVGGRRLVSAEAAADWRREREAQPPT